MAIYVELIYSNYTGLVFSFSWVWCAFWEKCQIQGGRRRSKERRHCKETTEALVPLLKWLPSPYDKWDVWVKSSCLCDTNISPADPDQSTRHLQYYPRHGRGTENCCSHLCHSIGGGFSAAPATKSSLLGSFQTTPVRDIHSRADWPVRGVTDLTGGWLAGQPAGNHVVRRSYPPSQARQNMFRVVTQ